jgi:hypothetical protein
MSSSSTSAAPIIAPLPDMNAETYPFNLVLHSLDEAAHFPLFSISELRRSTPITTPGSSSSAIGIRINERLHRFGINLHLPTQKSGVQATNLIGEPLARFQHRWMIVPDGFRAAPFQEPPPTPLNTSCSQRFVMLDSVCTFDNHEDGFRGFGIGRTFPTTVNGQPVLMAGAIGNIMEGFGKFQGLEGTYTYCGTLSPDGGFRGSLLCRVMDPGEIFRMHHSLPDLQPLQSCESDASYVLFRGQKKNRFEKTIYTFDSSGNVDGFKLSPEMRIFNIDCAMDGRGRLYSTSSVGPVIGDFLSYVFFNVLNPGAPGNAASPIKFIDYDNFVFCDYAGRAVGSFAFNGGAAKKLGFTAGKGGEGRAFNLTLPDLPGQRALRFGGFGPIFNGKEKLEDIQGLTCHNSVVGVTPHAIAITFLARINYPACDSRQKTIYVCKEVDADTAYKCERQ